jgi:hypothetical protein
LTYHTEFIPPFRPDYGKSLLTAYFNPRNPRWQREVLESCRHLIDLGCPSIGWDQFADYPSKPSLFTLVSEVRRLAKRRDGQSTLDGESASNIDNDARYLDYTWDWFSYPATGDPRPFASAYPAPRAQCQHRPLTARRALGLHGQPLLESDAVQAGWYQRLGLDR